MGFRVQGTWHSKDIHVQQRYTMEVHMESKPMCIDGSGSTAIPMSVFLILHARKKQILNSCLQELLLLIKIKNIGEEDS